MAFNQNVYITYEIECGKKVKFEHFLLTYLHRYFA